MRRLLVTTTALSVALTSVSPFPLMAQTVAEDGSIIADDGTILCLATDGNACNIEDFTGAAAGDAGGETKAERRARRQAEQEAADAAAAQAEADAKAAAEAEAAAQAEADAQAAAEAEAAAQAEADAQAAAEAEAAAQAEADAQAAAEAEAAAQAEADAQAAAEAEAAAQAEADAQAAAEAEAAAAEEAPVEDAAPAEEAAPEAAAEEPAAEAASDDLDAAMEQILEGEDAAPEDGAAADPVAEEPAAEEPAVDEQPAVDAATEEVAPEASDGAEAAIAEEPVTEEAVTEDAAAEDATTAEAEAAEPVEPVVNLDPVPEDQVELVAPTDQAVDELTTLLAQPEAIDEPANDDATAEAAPEVAAPLAAEILTAEPTDGIVDLADLPAPAEAAAVTVQQVTEETARSSSEEFRTAAKEGDTRTEAQKNRDRNRHDGKNGGKNGGKNRNDDDELSDLEKAGLVALGAVAVGMIINAANQDRVVANSGDRVVVQRGNGNYVVYKDDDALLRQPGSTVRTETYRDGSTRTIIQRADGTQIVTIRDATGRVLRRSAFDARGREILLVNDLQPETRVDVSTLPVPRGREITISGSEEDALLRARMAALDAEELGRSFSLRQIREIPQVRALAATVDVNNITFDSGSSAIKTTEAEELAALGRFITAMVRENPAEMFLIEGHTDAVGSAASNLALSDRRAESVALALTEYFGVPAENMIVQGYGESELRVNTQADERANRRVAVRVITPLLRTASAN